MIVGVILAGGRASRMGGGDKALLRLGGRPLVARVAERLRPQVEAVLLNANGDPGRFAGLGFEVVADTVPDLPGPLAGVLAGMERAAAMGAAAIVTAPCDAPFLPRDLCTRLAGAGPFVLAAGGDGRRHPTFGLWPVDLRVPLRAGIAAGARRVGAWMAEHGAVVARFDDEDAFFNVNEPGDLVAAEARVARLG
ncbi:MAG: molybdenum cofactor guanylyltransferase MobA [Amaricoccus sp.]|uniref:molybdenum cofactor guanylyltransferase MobA n=1 Tax=Amaricoccus sp. TaxID=1872485 RepID=UPI0039E5360B